MSHRSNQLEDIEIAIQLQRSKFNLDIQLLLPGRGISVLFGPSGCGKTTLLRCVAGLEAQTRGLIRVGEQVWLSSDIGFNLAPHQRSLGYVFQEASLFEHLNVKQNIEFGVKRARHLNAQQVLDDAIDLLGISHLLDRDVSGLSGGERQRIAIVRALATQPQILLLDEPLAALDQSRKHEVFPWLEKLRDELNIPMIYVTHSVDELARLGDYLVVLEQGEVKIHGVLTETMHALSASVTDSHEMGVLVQGVVDFKDEQWHLARIAFPGGVLWVPDDGLKLSATTRLRVLAKDVSLTISQPENTSIQNHICVTISEVVSDEQHPSQLLVRLRAGTGYLIARITQRAWHTLNLNVGQEVWAQIKSVAVVY
jgi:molybdate transport system ATP-binding protein